MFCILKWFGGLKGETWTCCFEATSHWHAGAEQIPEIDVKLKRSLWVYMLLLLISPSSSSPADPFPGRHGVRPKRMTWRYWIHLIWLMHWCVCVPLIVHVCLTWKYCWWPLYNPRTPCAPSAPPWRGQKTSSRQHNTGVFKMQYKEKHLYQQHTRPFIHYLYTSKQTDTCMQVHT